MIGKHYSYSDYNCAHFVSEWFLVNKGIEIPVINEFGMSFLVWMRRHFTEIKNPKNGCLVYMQLYDDKKHVGVYNDGYVIHNYKASIRSCGAVCKVTTGQVEREYKKVSYWQWSK